MKKSFLNFSHQSISQEDNKFYSNYGNESRISQSSLHKTLRNRLKSRIFFPSSASNLKNVSKKKSSDLKKNSRNFSQLNKINRATSLNNKEILTQTLNCDFIENWINEALKTNGEEFFVKDNSFGKYDRLNVCGINREILEVFFSRV